MNFKLNFVLIIFLAQISAFSQVEIQGIIIDRKTNSALAFVNVGIINKNIGTVSDENGNFSIILDKKFDMDSLKFSIIGYKTKAFIVSEMRQNYSGKQKIVLEKANYKIEEIVVLPKEFKTKILGSQAQSRMMQAGFSSNILGNEVGIRINIKNAPTFVENFNFYITQNEYDSLIFRLNIYTIEDDLPFENILTENIYLTTQIKYGAISFDLKKHNIYVEEDFIIALEWIKDLGEEGLYFAASFANGPIFSRKASQGDWEEASFIGLGFNVTAKYPK